MVAGEGPVLVARGCIPCHDDLAVVLDGDCVSNVPVETEVGGLLAIAAEGGVEAAIGVVTNDGEVRAEAHP